MGIGHHCSRCFVSGADHADTAGFRLLVKVVKEDVVDSIDCLDAFGHHELNQASLYVLALASTGHRSPLRLENPFPFCGPGWLASFPKPIVERAKGILFQSFACDFRKLSRVQTAWTAPKTIPPFEDGQVNP